MPLSVLARRRVGRRLSVPWRRGVARRRRVVRRRVVVRVWIGCRVGARYGGANQCATDDRRAPAPGATAPAPRVARAPAEAAMPANRGTVEAKAAEEGITFTSNQQMVAHPFVRKLIEDEVARLTSHLAQWETIKRFALLPDDFTFDNGGLTFTMKLKRRVVEQQFASTIESLYSDVTDPRPTIA